MSKYYPKPPNINPSKSPHGSHVPKQGNPCPNSKTKSQTLQNKMTQSEKDPQTPPSFLRLLPYPNKTPNHPTSPSARALTGSTAQKMGIPTKIPNPVPSPLQLRQTTQ